MQGGNFYSLRAWPLKAVQQVGVEGGKELGPYCWESGNLLKQLCHQQRKFWGRGAEEMGEVVLQDGLLRGEQCYAIVACCSIDSPCMAKRRSSESVLTRPEKSRLRNAAGTTGFGGLRTTGRIVLGGRRISGDTTVDAYHYTILYSGLPSSRKMRSYWRESSGGLRG